MTEKENEKEFEIQFFTPHESFRRRLCEFYLNNVVAVEFCCCGFLKTAVGCLNFIGPDSIELVGTTHGPVEINIDGPKGPLEPELAFRVLIPDERICSVQLLSKPPCPCPPCPGPRNVEEE